MDREIDNDRLQKWESNKLPHNGLVLSQNAIDYTKTARTTPKLHGLRDARANDNGKGNAKACIKQ